MNGLAGFAMLGGALVVAVALTAVFVNRRRRLPVHQLSAGAEVISTGQGRRPDPRAEAAVPVRSKTRRPSMPKIGRGRPEPPVAPAADPPLFSPMILAADTQWSVYHGALRVGSFRAAVRVATARGRSHAYEGTAGQDVAGLVWNERRGGIFAVVADGLGSKVDSGTVARELVDGLLARAERLRPADDPTAMIEETIRVLEELTYSRELDGATTVVAAEIRQDPAGATVTTWGIGDSEAWLLCDGTWTVLHHERRSDAQNVTRHLPGHRTPHTQRARVRSGSVVALASDGFASALDSRGASPVARELIDRWRRPPTPIEFLGQVNFEDPRFHDDRAAVAVWIR